MEVESIKITVIDDIGGRDMPLIKVNVESARSSYESALGMGADFIEGGISKGGAVYQHGIDWGDLAVVRDKLKKG